MKNFDKSLIFSEQRNHSSDVLTADALKKISGTDSVQRNYAPSVATSIVSIESVRLFHY